MNKKVYWNTIKFDFTEFDISQKLKNITNEINNKDAIDLMKLEEISGFGLRNRKPKKHIFKLTKEEMDKELEELKNSGFECKVIFDQVFEIETTEPLFVSDRGYDKKSSILDSFFKKYPESFSYENDVIVELLKVLYNELEFTRDYIGKRKRRLSQEIEEKTKHLTALEKESLELVERYEQEMSDFFEQFNIDKLHQMEEAKKQFSMMFEYNQNFSPYEIIKQCRDISNSKELKEEMIKVRQNESSDEIEFFRELKKIKERDKTPDTKITTEVAIEQTKPSVDLYSNYNLN